MGTCHSTRRRRHQLIVSRTSKSSSTSSKDDTTDRDTTDSSTLPLSPDSTAWTSFHSTSPLLEVSPPDPFESPRSSSVQTRTSFSFATHPNQHQDCTSPLDMSTAALTPSSHSKPQGRAYRTRLQKSRCLQQALDHPPVLSNTTTLDAKETLPEQQDASPLAAKLYFTSRTGPIWAQVPLTSSSSLTALALDPGWQQPLLCWATEDSVQVSHVAPTVQTPSDTTTSSTTTSNSITLALEGTRALDYAPHTRDLAVGGDDCVVTVYRLSDHSTTTHSKTATIVAQLDRIDRICTLQYSPGNGQYLAVGGFDGLVAVYDCHDHYNLLSELAMEGLCFALAWNHDGTQLAFGGSDKRVSILHVHKSWTTTQAELPVHQNVLQLAWKPHQPVLAVAVPTGVLLLQTNHSNPARTAAVEREIRFPGKKHHVCWSPNASYLVVSASSETATTPSTKDSSVSNNNNDNNSPSHDNTHHCCTVLETKSYAMVQEITRTAPIQSLTWREQPVLTGLPRRYLVIGDEQSVGIIQTGVELAHATAADDPSVVSSSLTSEYSTTSLTKEAVWKERSFRDMDDMFADTTATGGTAGACIGSNNPFLRPSNANVIAVAFSRGSKSRSSTYLAYSTEDCLVTVLATADWKPVAELRFAQPVTSLAFTLGSRYLAYGCQDAKVYVSETGPNWALVATTALSAPVRSLVFVGDKKETRYLGVGTNDGCFALLDAKEKYRVQTKIDDDSSPVTAVDWTAKHFCVGRENGTVRIYDTETHECVTEIVRRGATVQSLAFGLSGRCLAVGVSDGHVAIYSAKGGWVLCHQFKAGSASVQSVQWTPTGRFLAIGDEKGHMRLMDTIFWVDVEDENAHAALWLNGGKEEQEDAISNPFFPLDFSQDGKLLAFARSHSGVRVARTTDWKLAFVLCQSDALTVASLSQEEDEDDA